VVLYKKIKIFKKKLKKRKKERRGVAQLPPLATPMGQNPSKEI
jgi:hypothetical protein